MKLAGIAVAVVAAAAAMSASAQSNVTLYGIIDIGYLYTNPASGPSLSEVADGIQSQSRFGIRGVERLTPSINAGFTLEGGISADTGTSQQSGRLFGRQAWLSLFARSGEFRLAGSTDSATSTSCPTRRRSAPRSAMLARATCSRRRRGA